MSAKPVRSAQDTPAADAPSAKPTGGSKPSQVADLVAIGSRAELFRTPDASPFATVRVGDGHRLTLALRSAGMTGWLRREYYQSHEVAAGKHAIDEALDELEARALYLGEVHPVHVRVGQADDGRLFLDLGDAEGRCIEIDSGQWRVVQESPVRFRRSASQLPLPAPVRGGSLDELRGFVNVGEGESGEATFRILVAWLLASFRPRGPYPVLNIRAEQGAAKTTTARVIRRLIDPAKPLEIGLPRDQESLAVAAYHHHVVSIDNVSSIPRWLSDDLARLATGLGISMRQKYTNLDELSLDLCRPIILNGIEDFIASDDLADRAWALELPALADDHKWSEEAFEAAFSTASGRLLGAVLDAVAAAHAGAGSIELTKPTRMIDATRFAVAAERALCWPPGELESDLAEMRAGSRASALESSPLTAPIKALARRDWSGTAGDLLQALQPPVNDPRGSRPVGWPMTARQLSSRLRRLAPALRREESIEVRFGQREAHTGKRLISLKFLGESTVTIVTQVTLSTDSGDETLSDAFRAGHPEAKPIVTLPESSGDDGDDVPSGAQADRHPATERDGDDGDDGDDVLFQVEREKGEENHTAVARVRVALANGQLAALRVELGPGEVVEDAARFARTTLAEAMRRGPTGRTARRQLARLAAALGPAIEPAQDGPSAAGTQ